MVAAVVADVLGRIGWVFRRGRLSFVYISGRVFGSRGVAWHEDM